MQIVSEHLSHDQVIFTNADVRTAREALIHFGVEPTSIRRVRRGRNTHWIVRASTERVVLRRYSDHCGRAEVSYELAVLRHMRGRGWPVHAPIGEPLESSAGIWCLFPYLAGRSPTPRSAVGRHAEQVARGRLLARLHDDLGALRPLGQRRGWLTTPEGLYDRGGKRPADEVLRDFARRDPDRGRILLGYSDIAREQLAALMPKAPAPTVIHGDLTPWNMRYAAGRLTAILDFDGAHLDLRVADFALSWRGRHEGVLEGYEAESPLSEVERELLLPVYWASMVADAVADIDEGNGDPQWALTHLLRQPSERVAYGITRH